MSTTTKTPGAPKHAEIEALGAQVKEDLQHVLAGEPRQHPEAVQALLDESTRGTRDMVDLKKRLRGRGRR